MYIVPTVPVCCLQGESENTAGEHVPREHSTPVPRETSTPVPREPFTHVPLDTSTPVPLETSKPIPEQFHSAMELDPVLNIQQAEDSLMSAPPVRSWDPRPQQTERTWEPQPNKSNRIVLNTTNSLSNPSTIFQGEALMHMKTKRTPKAETVRRAKVSGRAYTSLDGKLIPAKLIGQPCQCRANCATKISNVQRRTAFENFYKLKTNDAQRESLASHVVQRPPNKHRQNVKTKPRRITNLFVLKGDNQMHAVCKPFFCSTFGIKASRLNSILRRIENGRLKRNIGKRRNCPKSRINEARIHIKKIPKCESHYCRAGSKRKFFNDPTLTFRTAYQHYVSHFAKARPISYKAYTKLCKRSGLSKRIIKKDKCGSCKMLSGQKLAEHRDNVTARRLTQKAAETDGPSVQIDLQQV